MKIVIVTMMNNNIIKKMMKVVKITMINNNIIKK